VLAKINAVRADPAGYARELEDYESTFEGRVAYLPGDPNGRLTREGRPAVEEAITFLLRQRPLPPLQRAPMLTRAAGRYADIQGASGATGHYGADRSSPGSRVQAEGGSGFVAEIISYGPLTPDDVVRQFVIDDGVPSRGHRMLMFGAAYRFAGVGCAEHRVYGGECVVDLGQTIDGRPGPIILPARSNSP
jgi:uncharacterized protein YkwD